MTCAHLTVGATTVAQTCYISEVVEQHFLASGGFDAIVEQAHGMNPRHEITGSLIFAQVFFVQFFEGPPRAVERLMANLRRDRRHVILREFALQPTETRRFRGWTMGYAGNSVYVARSVERVLASTDTVVSRSTRVLFDILEKFGETGTRA